MRVSYDRDTLLESDLAKTPLGQFEHWLADAVAHPDILEPNAMVLATLGQVPSARSVLLKGIDSRGLTFFTNYDSRKAQEMADHANVSVVFPWYSLHRQVIVIGTVQQVSREESHAYFRTRPHLSQLGAHASHQSAPIDNRDILETTMSALVAKYPEGSQVPMPDFWGGYLICVTSMEFWQGRRSRLHDRLRFERVTGTNEQNNAEQNNAELDVESNWRVQRYSP
ncbi:MAG: pyridoxamine 5'-phosphate oxidase [Actinobacteria bacterium]|nr:pyridoxamine 5'-phosphate oxidase [Actinomycetota bacterium]